MSYDISPNATIKVENSGEHRYRDVKDLIVKIGDKFFLRHDDTLVHVRNSEGKLRFFRKDSPYVIKLRNGKYLHKSQALMTEDGIWFDKADDSFIELEGKYYRREYCTKIDGRFYLMSDKNLVRTYTGTYALKNKAIKLEESVYGANQFVKESESLESEDGIIVKGDQINILDGESNEIKYYHGRGKRARDKQFNVFKEFNDKTNPQEDRITLANAFESDRKYFEPIDLTNGAGPIVLVNIKSVDYVRNCIDDFIMPRISAKMEQWRDKLNSMYSDLDEHENKAKSFKVIARNWPGKQNIYTPEKFHTLIKSKIFDLTGGLKFSFGVEFETSQGVLTAEDMEKTLLRAVGDRSIGAAEYVTPPMEGNSGVEQIKLMCETLASKTLVDDRCGLHVHVGGLTKAKGPSFSREFIKNAINLGSFIEEELYSTLPPNRTPTLYHCHSIRRFGGVTEKNFDLNVGAFIFGPKEVWFNSKQEPKQPFDFTPFKLNSDRNSHSSLGAWAEGRYKWLNLIHSFTVSEHKTIEFRIFPGTTNFEKTYMYLLLSLAFTYVADNCPALIKEGVKLKDLFEASFDDEKLIKEVTTFYENRKKRFNRKNIYPKSPYLTFLK